MIGGLLKSTSSLAIIAAAGMFIGGLTLSPAQAADLGGDCCADLEERVADLEATTARKGNRKVSLKVSGFINRSFGWYEDDAGSSEFYAAGRGGSYGSRLKFSGSAKLTANWKAGYVFRFRTTGDTGLPGAAGATNAGNPGSAPGASNNRTPVGSDLDYVYLSGPIGTFVTGHAYVPSKQISNISLGGHGVIGSEGNAWHGDGTNGFELEQNGAHQAVAYISPTLAGFTFSIAWADLNNAVPVAGGDAATDLIDTALRYANEFGPLRIAAGISGSFSDNDANVVGLDGYNINGSLALLHTPTGLNVAVHAGQEVDGGLRGGRSGTLAQEASFWHVEAGISQNFFGPGKTSVYGEYGVYDNDTLVGSVAVDEVTMLGLGIVQHFDSAATELYLAYRQWNGEINAGTDFGDGDTQQILAGMRIKF